MSLDLSVCFCDIIIFDVLRIVQQDVQQNDDHDDELATAVGNSRCSHCDNGWYRPYDRNCFKLRA